MDPVLLGQGQQLAHPTAAALVAVADVPGHLIGAGIQLDAVRCQDQQPVGRDPDMLVPDQMVADFNKGLLHPPFGNPHKFPQEQGQG